MEWVEVEATALELELEEVMAMELELEEEVALELELEVWVGAVSAWESPL